jgi:periplasmic protein CpxP/Spy
MKHLGIRKFAPAMALLFTVGVTLASAEDSRLGRKGMGHGMGGGILRGLSRLNLTDDQKAEVRRIMDARRATFEALHAKIDADAQALREAADGSSPDPAVVGAAYLRVHADRKALRAEKQAAMDQVRSILTPEQKERLDSMRENRKERFRNRMESRGGA